MSEPVIEANVPIPDAPKQRARVPEKTAPISDTPAAAAAPSVPMRKSVIPELYRFARGLSADTPYHELVAAATSSGWIWKMTETSCLPTNMGSMLVRFEVEIGKSTNDLELEYFDTISMVVPIEAPSPSLIARLNAQVALIYMVFGRLPPQPVSAPAPAPVAEPEPARAPVVEDTQPEWTRDSRGPMQINATRTRDGIVVLEDPYSKDGRPDDIVPALLSRFEEALDEINDAGLINVLWSKNAQAIEFVKDFGGEKGRNDLAALFRARANFLNRN